MEKLSISEINRRLDNATPAPWFVKYAPAGKRSNTVIFAENHALSRSSSEVHGHGQQIATVWNVTCTCIQGHQYDNQEFIAHARTDIELLLAEVKRLKSIEAKYDGLRSLF